ncbi:autotransporter family protein [Maricaulis sp. CAU 1757]
MRRRFMLASALVSMTIAAPLAHADREITTEVNGPIETSTAGSGGGADNIVITSTGRVTVTGGGTGIRLNSDNSVTNSGEINGTSDNDGARGVHIISGNSGTFRNDGAINLSHETAAVDDDGDGRTDGPLANGGDRVAILVDGTQVFSGDILLSTSGSITVVGNDSAGLRVLTGVDGDINASNRFTIRGNNSRAVDINAPVTGDVIIGGSMASQGEGSEGVGIRGDVGGGVRFTNSMLVSGYRFPGRPMQSMRDTLDAEDRAQSGSAIVLNGNVGNGVYIAGPNDVNTTEPTANITVRGSAPTFHVFADASSGDIVLGEVVLPAIADDPNTEADESRAEQFLGYSLVNRGELVASGELDGVAATSFRMEGRDGQTATLSDGFTNEGDLRAASWEAAASTAILGDGAIIPTWHNTGLMLAASSGTAGIAQGLVIEAGGALSELVNEGQMLANATLGGSSYVVIDRSGTLTSISNSGLIGANYTPPTDPANAVAYETVAIDLRGGNSDATIRQFRASDAEEEWVVAIRGDIYMGGGADSLLVESGEIRGDLDFGLGADRLMISGGALVSGNLNDSDGDLLIDVADGELRVGSETNTTIREAIFRDGSVLRFQIDEDTGAAARLDATGTVTFQEGSRVQATLANLIGDGASLVVLTANDLVIAETLDILQDTSAPYLYESSLDFDPNDSNALVLTLRRRDATELGMNSNQAAAYDAAYEGWRQNAELGAAFASLMSEDEFFTAYDQLLPEYASSAIQFALASNDSAIGALANRLEAVRRSPDETGGLWIQEFGYFADRAGTAFGPGYRGYGIGVAAGFDRPIGPFYSVGLNFTGAASEIEESDGFDDPMTALTGQLGLYAGAELPGNLLFDVYGGIGYDHFEHNRSILIGDFEANPTATWSGYHVTGAARLARNFEFGSRYFVRPALTIDYLSLFEDSYVESGGGAGIDLAVDERDSSSLSSSALLTFGARFENSQSWWSPHARVGFRSEFTDADTETTAQFVGYDDTFTLRSQQIPGSGFIFGLGLTAGSGYSTFSLAYDADVREDFIRHTARLVMRMVF